MSDHYGRFIGERGTHFISRDAEIEVIGFHWLDNNRATYRFYGGDRSGETFSATAEHFEPKQKLENCPTCGARVYSIFDHLGDDCPAETDRQQ
jgi:hypothetical protein